jgi:hypothetical protein
MRRFGILRPFVKDEADADQRKSRTAAQEPLTAL